MYYSRVVRYVTGVIMSKGNKLSQSDGSSASYYELPESAEQLQDLISHCDMNAQIGEIFRACYRYGRVAHSPKLRDAKKIKYYIEAEIARLEKLEGTQASNQKYKSPV